MAGLPGFWLLLRYRNDQGVSFERLLLGTVLGKDVHTFSDRALAHYFFAHDREAFERFVTSY